MPSSTSSSNQRLPGGSWARAWLLGLVVACLTVTSAEAFWRAMGHAPSVNDDAALWMLARASVRPNEAREIVLLGASRIQQGLDLELFAKRFGGRKPIQLAVGGTTFLPVLDDLSRDPSFRGIAIADAAPFLFYRGGFSLHDGPAAEYVARYRQTIGSRKTFNLGLFERRLRTLVQQTLVFRLPALAPTFENLQTWVEKRELPRPSGRMMFGDRSQKADYRTLDSATLERTKQLWVERIRRFGYGPPPDEFRDGLQALEATVRRIENRGGRVVFLALPVSGIVRDKEEEYLPRKGYWDVLAAHTTALTIHFEDYPELASIECLEGSHLDYRDAQRFTAAFATILTRELARRTEGCAAPQNNPNTACFEGARRAGEEVAAR